MVVGILRLRRYNTIMGEKLRHRRGLVASAGLNVFGTSIIIPDVGMKIVVSAVPQVAGVLSIVRIDGVEERVSKMFDGNNLVPFQDNKSEAMTPKFYSFVPNEVAINFRYSVLVTFSIFTVYAEKDHAWALQLI